MSEKKTITKIEPPEGCDGIIPAYLGVGIKGWVPYMRENKFYAVHPIEPTSPLNGETE